MSRGDAERGERTPDPAIMLELLRAVERDSNLSQRSLSRELDIALGLANAYMRRCVRKGLVKVRQAPLNRYGYYITPKGFAEKARLTTEYLSLSFDFFRDARRQCAALLESCDTRSQSVCVLVGDGDLAEIAVLSAGEANVEILCVVDQGAHRSRCAGRPVVQNLDAAAGLAVANGGIDYFMITDVQAPQATYDALWRAVTSTGLPESRILAPELLLVARQSPTTARAAIP